MMAINNLNQRFSGEENQRSPYSADEIDAAKVLYEQFGRHPSPLEFLAFVIGYRSAAKLKLTP